MSYSRAQLEDTVVNRIKELFPDMQEIEAASLPYRKKLNLDLSALQIILYDLNNERINFKQYAMTVLDKILHTNLLQSKDEINLQYTFEVYYKTIIVLYMSYLPQNQVELFQTPEELYDLYPEYKFDSTYENDLWYDLTKAATRLRKKRTDAAVIERVLSNQHATEIDRLLIFRNFMRLCLMMISPEGNKNILLKVVAKLEGSGQSYITGGDPRPATRRRIRVYEKESGIKAKRKNSGGGPGFAPSNFIPSFNVFKTEDSSSSSNSNGENSGGGGGLISLLVESSAEFMGELDGGKSSQTDTVMAASQSSQRTSPLYEPENTLDSLAEAAGAIASVESITDHSPLLLKPIPVANGLMAPAPLMFTSTPQTLLSPLPYLSSVVPLLSNTSSSTMGTTNMFKKPKMDDFSVKYSLKDLVIPEVPELECLLY